jgi:uracil-DNA glycosylase family 4
MIFSKDVFNSAINKPAIKECIKCSALCTSRTQVVVDKYTKLTASPWEEKTLPIMIIGEAPGETEDLVGMPFMGVSGKVLDQYLAAHEIQSYSYITNIVKCRPEKNRTPTAEEIKNCAPYLEQQIKALQPKVIVTLGKSAMAGLQTIGEIVNSKTIDWKKSEVASYFNFEDTCYPVIPIYHPSYYLRQKNALSEDAWSEFQTNYDAKFLKVKSYISCS